MATRRMENKAHGMFVIMIVTKTIELVNIKKDIFVLICIKCLPVI